MVEFFKLLQESGLLTAAFTIGAVCIILAIISSIKTVIELPPARAVLLGGFGLCLIALSIAGYFISVFGLASHTTLEAPTRETAVVTATSRPTVIVQQPPPTEAITTPVVQPPVSELCYGNCWEYDHVARTMTWTGPADGSEDIWQAEGIPLDTIRAGYTAVFVTSIPIEMEICVGEVDGSVIGTQCTPQVIKIAPGTHRVISAGPQGGFRAHPKRQ